MQSFRFRRSMAGLTLGLVLVSGSLAYGYEDYPPSGYDTGSYDRGYSTRPRDRYNSYDSTQSPYSPPASQSPYSSPAPQAPAGNGVPFGLSKSTAGAILGGLLGAGSGAIIGSHRGKALPGAAIGGGLGAVGGYAVGHQLDSRDQALNAQDQLIEQQRREIARNRTLLEELKRQKLDARETERGVVVNLPDVLFQFNSARLTPEAQDKVSHIATVLNERAKERRVSVEGHTDSIGGEAYNLTLSEHRAESVAQALRSDSVREARLTTKGYGKKYPVAPNTNADGSDNPAGRAKNRRVEVVIAN
ncbi:MAG TPA: OmpA family protein [Candidatus Binatia bacterium]|nr:OmpA family protein [Candidatus Binatia bacterium]